MRNFLIYLSIMVGGLMPLRGVMAAVDCRDIVEELTRDSSAKDPKRLQHRRLMEFLTGAPDTSAKHSRMDSETIHDLDLPSFQKLMGSPLTKSGSKRLAWKLSHPNLSVPDIHKFQTTFQYLTKNFAEWGKIREVVRESSKTFDTVEDLYNGKSSQGFLFELKKKQDHALVSLSAVLFAGAPLYLWLTHFKPLAEVQPDMNSMTGLFLLAAIFNVVPYKFHTYTLRKNVLEVKTLLQQAHKIKNVISSSDDPYIQSLAVKMNGLIGDDSRLRKVQRRLKFVLRQDVGIFGDFFVGQAAWSLIRLAKDIANLKQDIAEVSDVVAELDYLASATLWIHENRNDLNYPELVDGGVTMLEIIDAHHPYVLAEKPKSVQNSFTAKFGESNFLLLTGPNLGGKSTYVRMIALHLTLGMMGLPVPAQRMRFTPMHIMTNMDISDSLKNGKSYFDNETDRLLNMIDMVNNKQPTFFGLDEILLGTNPEERQAAEAGFIRYVAKRNHIFILATHDLTMTSLEGVVPGFKNIHVDEIVRDDNVLEFPYKVLDGPTPHRNALRVLRSKHFPDEMLGYADEWKTTHGGTKP